MNLFPALSEIDAACRAYPEFSKAAPENQIDTPHS